MKKIILSALLLGAFSAFANEAGDDDANRAEVHAHLTRAEVKAAYAQARADGSLPDTSEAGAGQSQQIAGTAARGSLKAEALQAARTRVIHELM